MGGEAEAVEEERQLVSEKTEQEEAKPATDQSMKKRYSPAVLRLAQEHDINLEQVTGTGKSGRITRKDVEKIIASGKIPAGHGRILGPSIFSPMAGTISIEHGNDQENTMLIPKHVLIQT